MKKISSDADRRGVLDELLLSATTGVVPPRNGFFSRIKGTEIGIARIPRTHETIRIVLQSEFEFSGVVGPPYEGGGDPLALEWFDSSFVVADTANVALWLKKCAEERAKGKDLVVLLPAKTGADWFHSQVLGEAAEVRFVKGLYQIDPRAPQACLVAVFRGGSNRSDRKRGRRVLRASFAEDGVEEGVVEEDVVGEPGLDAPPPPPERFLLRDVLENAKKNVE